MEGKGDSVLGDIRKIITWHVGLASVKRALQDERDDERDVDYVFTVSFDGSDNRVIPSASNLYFLYLSIARISHQK